jgi:hypothetical protein
MHRWAHVAVKINSHLATIPPQAQRAQAVAERDRMIEAPMALADQSTEGIKGHRGTSLLISGK